MKLEEFYNKQLYTNHNTDITLYILLYLLYYPSIPLSI